MKQLLTAFTIALLFCGLFFVGSTVKGVTNVSGVISSDTTWTKANSPYTLTGKTLVSNGVTLSIEPGVTVNIKDDVYLQVNGTLIARGTGSDKIYFNGGQIRFTEASVSYSEQTGFGCIIENAVIYSGVERCVSVTDCSPKLNDNVFNCQLFVTRGSPLIVNNYFTGEVHVAGGFCVISKNTIKGGGLHFDQAQSLNALVSENTISDCLGGSGIYVATRAMPSDKLSLTIERNLLIDNYYGIMVDSLISPVICNNTIANNKVGIKILDYKESLYTIKSNNIINNKEHNLALSLWSTADIDATYNWWGTTDTAAINQSIYDSKNDFNLGKVNFIPLLSEPNPNAPDASTLVPTPSPSPTPTPDQNGFLIESNSTISAFSFNSTTPEISFTVSGPSGTTGYVKAAIPKNFMPYAGNIQVYLDGNQINYELALNENSWIVTFTYQHSTHQVTINSATNQVADTFMGVEYWIWAAAIVIFALAGVSVLIVWLTKKKA